MQAAVAKDQLSIQSPVAGPAQRVAAGYTQLLTSTSAPPITYLVAKADSSPSAWIVTGDNLTRYTALGGAAGPLGYPTSDGVGTGHQLFANGALASSPARLVTGAILTKWTALGFETGAAGLPTADATTTTSSSGVKALQQTFAKGTIFAETNGANSGQAQFVFGLILARYQALGGPGSSFGLPTDDASMMGAKVHQDFEGGYIDYTPGDAAAVEHGAQRSPAVSATPSSVVAGSRLHLAVTGFADGATLQVSISGQSPFVVTAATGSYAWDTYIPLTAASSSVTIQATDITNGASGGALTSGSYAVKALSSSTLQLAKTQGDTQTGAPGAKLAQSLQVRLQDGSGNPVSGIPVTFGASPGGQIITSTTMTDGSGLAQATVRMPPAPGLALFTAQAGSQVATFSATAAAMSLNNYPTFKQSDAPYGVSVLGAGPASIAQKGALLTSAAGILQYYINSGSLPGTSVSPGSLNQYLQGLCTTAADGSHLCDGFLTNPGSSEQVANLWRIAGLVGGVLDVSIESPDVTAARDMVAQGNPALLALALTANGAPAGGHYVVATGIASDGSLLIQDPSPDFAQSSLNAYTAGFQAGGSAWEGTLSGVVRLAARAPSGSGFLVSLISQPAALMQQLSLDISSASGACGRPADFGDQATLTPAAAPGISRLQYCNGAAPIYQVSLAAPQAYRAVLTDLATGGGIKDLSGSGASVAYQASRPVGPLVVAPQSAVISAGGVVNGATFTQSPGLAPGGLMAILGAGLAAGSSQSATLQSAPVPVQINGEPATVISQTPLQLNVQVPPDLSGGSYSQNVQTPYGAAEQMIQTQATAPAIFIGSGGTATAPEGVILNQDGSVNAPTSPGRRGQMLVIYCTGLGAVDGSTPANAVTMPTVVLNGAELQPIFAGMSSGYIGLYQVNFLVPATAPPGIDLPLLLRQPGGDSNTVFVAIQ